MKKSMQKSSTVAPLTARASQDSGESRRAGEPSSGQNPWLSKHVAKRLEEGRSLLIDMATDLPFATVLRGRVPPPKPEVVAQVDPMLKLFQRFGPQLPKLPIDTAYLQERRSLIDLLADFEKAGENFLGLIKRTRAVMTAQLEKAMKGAFVLMEEVAPKVPGMPEALAPLHPVLAGKDQKK